MKRYIDKDALVAEIENYKNSIGEDGEHCSLVVGRHEGQRKASEHFLSFIDTLEVKEVDLEEELDSYFAKFKGLENWNWRIDSINIHAQGIYDFAKHFFELGLKVQKGE